MKENGQLKKYLYKSLAGAGSIIICIIVFFAMYRFDRIVAAYNLIKGILMPFIYGAVIAYLLTPSVILSSGICSDFSGTG